jgi:hypothetical protein
MFWQSFNIKGLPIVLQEGITAFYQNQHLALNVNFSHQTIVCYICFWLEATQ